MTSIISSKFSLILIGVLVGCGLGVVVGFTVKATLQSKPDGAVYETPEELRAAISQRDSRDRSPEGVSLRSIIRPNLSNSILYELQPSLNVRFKNAQISINKDGYRGRLVSKQKGEDTFRIILLGDSFAFGWGVEEDETFAFHLEQILNKRLEGKPNVEVINFGVPGYSTFQQVALFEEKGMEYKPDAVLVYFVDNDFGMPFFIRRFDDPESMILSQQVRSHAKEVSGNHEAEENVRGLYRNMDPNQALNHLSGLLSQSGAKLYLTINPRRKSDIDRKALHVIDLKPPVLTLIPMRKRFVALVKERGIDRNSLILSKVDTHPSPGMHVLLAELLADSIEPDIRLNMSDSKL
jgi:lysophospholipase L1-like esterase